jgi:N-dimethylarginine dimethylaminohydrolase
MQSIKWHIPNESSPLEAVMIGIGTGMGKPPTLEETYDPLSRHHVLKGTYPTEQSVSQELNAFAEELRRIGIQVLRPDGLGINQVFTRDIGVVIENQFIMTHLVEDREEEQKGLESMLHRNPGIVLRPPATVRMEGGDIIPMGKEIWVGYASPKPFANYTTARTNIEAIAWLENQFPEKRIIGFELNKSDTDSLQNALHLDCCCAPLGMGHLLMHRQGFAKQNELATLLDRYPESHIMDITAQEMQTMHCNVFSIAPDTVVSNRSFERTNAKMKSWGYKVIEVELSETSKMGGLLRCSTLPLRRK